MRTFKSFFSFSTTLVLASFIFACGGCTSPSFASNSSFDVLVLNCLVTVVGDLPLTVKSATGEVIYTTTLSVPKPQVSIITNKGSFTLELDLTSAPITAFKQVLWHRVDAK